MPNCTRTSAAIVTTWEMGRGTPTIDGNRVYVEGGDGDVTCLDVASGKTLWHVHLQRQFGGGRPGWGYYNRRL